ncbi:Chaperone protein dnaJ 49 [Cardamine amara subsp. amara]|uniref:Chaperone protein dnaJ 49 n=1 Tax=Cardamine amara subsp. amara TaxID=228776 RepID=A0ABD1BS26_CARAN
MECDKDEAKKAMDIAEKKITEKDYNGAKTFANKAQRLFPNHDGLKQLLTIIEVYISGEKKFAGEADWYGILGVDPCSVDEVLKKQYRKLALMLHPDKNKCKGADGAFQLLSEAWSHLSDTSKRTLYNEKRGLEPPGMGSSPFVSSGQKESLTFRTKCDKCGAQHEFLRLYVNLTLFCPKCRMSFVCAEEITPSRSAYSNSQNATNEAANDTLKRGFAESQETDADTGSTNSDLRNCKKPETNDSYMPSPFSGK